MFAKRNTCSRKSNIQKMKFFLEKIFVLFLKNLRAWNLFFAACYDIDNILKTTNEQTLKCPATQKGLCIPAHTKKVSRKQYIENAYFKREEKKLDLTFE